MNAEIVRQLLATGSKEGVMALFALLLIGAFVYLAREIITNGFSLRVNGRKQ